MNIGDGFTCCMCGAHIAESKDWFNPWHDAYRVMGARGAWHMCSSECRDRFIVERPDLRSSQDATPGRVFKLETCSWG